MTLAYHGGRIASYTALGAALGFAAGSIDIAGWTLALRYLAGILLIAMGLYIADWWRVLTWLERGGALLWRPVQRWSQSLLPLRHWYQGAALGLCWGLMPCGLIYSSLAWAATAQDAGQSALMMLFFGLGTLPGHACHQLGGGSRANGTAEKGPETGAGPAADRLGMLDGLPDCGTCRARRSRHAAGDGSRGHGPQPPSLRPGAE